MSSDIKQPRLCIYKEKKEEDGIIVSIFEIAPPKNTLLIKDGDVFMEFLCYNGNTTLIVDDTRYDLNDNIHTKHMVRIIYKK